MGSIVRHQSADDSARALSNPRGVSAGLAVFRNGSALPWLIVDVALATIAWLTLHDQGRTGFAEVTGSAWGLPLFAPGISQFAYKLPFWCFFCLRENHRAERGIVLSLLAVCGITASLWGLAALFHYSA